MDKMDEETAKSFEIEKIGLNERLESLAKEGGIKRAYPLIENENTRIHVYKSGGFNIATYFNGAKEVIEFSKYDPRVSKSLSSKIQEIEKKVNYKFN